MKMVMLVGAYGLACVLTWLCVFFPAAPLLGSQLWQCLGRTRNGNRIDLLPYDIDNSRYVSRNYNNSTATEFPSRYWITPNELSQIVHEIPRLSQSGIPKIIHQSVSSRDSLSADTLRMAASWNCLQDWVHVLWDDCERGHLVQTDAPELLPLLNRLPKQVQRADIFRNVVLRSFGGVYCDTDFECINGMHVESGIDGNCGAYAVESSTPSVDGALQSSLLASVPGHPFWDFLLANASVTSMPTFFQSWFGTQPVIETTGPRFFSSVFDSYSKAHSSSIKVIDHDRTAICGLDPFRFNRYGDKTPLHELRKDKHRATVHRGAHSWGKGRKSRHDTPFHHATYWAVALATPLFLSISQSVGKIRTLFFAIVSCGLWMQLGNYVRR
jgi:mannosyltransferase OCH1-like enzyme